MHNLSPKLNNEAQATTPEISEDAQLKGYLCKTSQLQSNMSNKIFYKRYYDIEFERKRILVRAKEDTMVKEKFDLT